MGKLSPLAVKSAVKKAKKESKEIRKADGKGLFLRVRPSGAKSWIYYFRMPGNRALQQITIGSDEEYDLPQAREIRKLYRKQVKEGLDPRKVRAAEITRNTEAITVQTLFDSWVAFLTEGKAVTAKWLKAHEGRWKNHFKNHLGSIFASDVSQEHLANTLDIMASRGIREETRKSLTMLNQMFEYGRQRRLVKDNPARMLKPKDFSVSANPPRERVLSLKELRSLWVALEGDQIDANNSSSKMSVITATAIKILILTGARRGEVVTMEWKDIKWEESVWVIPSTKTKNRKSHSVFLSPITVSLLESLMRVTGESNYVFDTGLNSNGHIHVDVLTKAVRRLMKPDKATEPANAEATKPPLAGIEPFTVHDIRRSVATHCAEELKVAPHVIEKMLNHQPLNKLTRTYQRTMYSEEQKDAWLKWGKLVEHQVANEPTNIIPFKNKQAI